MAQTVYLASVHETEGLGRFLASTLTGGDTVLLYGDLGAGKTSLSRGFIREFTKNDLTDTPSPSYLLTFTYSGPTGKVHHMDPYRLASGKIAGVFDFQVAVKEDVLLIEWPERLGSELESFIRANCRVTEIRFAGSGVQGVGRQVEISSHCTVPSDLSLFASQTADLSLVSEDQPQSSDVHSPPLDGQSGFVLGIESSCDDTAAALICCATGRVVAEAIASQSAAHSEFGGVVPKLAQSLHAQNIDQTVQTVLDRLSEIEGRLQAVAVTTGPGLSLCLQIGVRKALEISRNFQVPLVKVHHLEAHVMVTRLPSNESRPEFPFLILLASGGHTLLAISRGLGQHVLLGGTLDDSAGEAFDKVARMLGIEKVPGGAELEQMASGGRSENLSKKLPIPLANSRDPVLRNNCDFSFAGLKTAVRMLLEENADAKADIAAAFQERVVQHLTDKTRRAIEWTMQTDAIKHIVLAGGVAANKSIRAALQTLATQYNLSLCVPPLKLCADNGVMVAWTGIERLRVGLYDAPIRKDADIEKFVEMHPRWPLGPKDPRSIGKIRVPNGRNPRKREISQIDEASSPK